MRVKNDKKQTSGGRDTDIAHKEEAEVGISRVMSACTINSGEATVWNALLQQIKIFCFREGEPMYRFAKSVGTDKETIKSLQDGERLPNILLYKISERLGISEESAVVASSKFDIPENNNDPLMAEIVKDVGNRCAAWEIAFNSNESMLAHDNWDVHDEYLEFREKSKEGHWQDNVKNKNTESHNQRLEMRSEHEIKNNIIRLICAMSLDIDEVSSIHTKSTGGLVAIEGELIKTYKENYYGGDTEFLIESTKYMNRTDDFYAFFLCAEKQLQVVRRADMFDRMLEAELKIGAGKYDVVAGTKSIVGLQVESLLLRRTIKEIGLLAECVSVGEQIDCIEGYLKELKKYKKELEAEKEYHDTLNDFEMLLRKIKKYKKNKEGEDLTK